jgi:F-type H+-transporting ATPase subunit b
MLIDWFTVGAQALNFAILVWLLKRFLYKPILNAVDAREKLIAGKLADADAKEAKAQSERDAFQQKNEAFDKKRAALLTKAADEAAAEGRKLLDDARKAADTLSAKRQETLENDADALNDAIRLRTQQEVFAIARKTLTDLADADLDERMGEVFTQRLRGMAGKAKATFGAALTSGAGPALLRSAFDLPAKQRAAIQTTLDETFSTQVKIRFETAPNLVSGIELSANGQKIAWSIADYLTSLEKSVEDLLKDRDKPEPANASGPETKVKVAAKAKAKPKAKTKAKPHAAKPKARRR